MRNVLAVLLGLAAAVPSHSPLRAGRLSSVALRAKPLAAIGLTLIGSTPVISSDPTAAQILERVSEAYQSLRTFSFVVEQSPGVVGFHSQAPGLETRVTESRPGRVQLSNEKYTMVSDGAVTWVYLHGENQYTAINAAPLLQETWRISPLGFVGWQYLRNYARIPAGGAKLEGEKVLRVDGKSIQCYVVSVPVSYRFGLRPWVVGTEELWISKSPFMVWRTARSAGGYIGYPTLTLKVVNTGPMPASDFRFDPPRGAMRVSQLAPNEGLYLSSNGLYDAPNAGSWRVLGQTAPDFTLRGLDGKGSRLKDMQGTTVVLDFWASWCKPCQEELEAIQKLHEELASKGVVFLGIDDEDPETVKSFVQARGYTFPMLLDTEQTVHQLYGVRWAPTTVVIDRKGKIAAHYVGAGGEAQLRRALKSAGLNTTP